MTRASVLARARSFAQGGFIDTCTITRLANGAVDENTGRIAQSVQTIYEGVCRVQNQRAQSRAEEVGEDRPLLLPMEIQLPMTVTALRVGDKVTITASVNDADLVGRVFQVRDLAHKSEASARRIRVEEVTT
jgi:hypothetical protein